MTAPLAQRQSALGILKGDVYTNVDQTQSDGDKLKCVFFDSRLSGGRLVGYKSAEEQKVFATEWNRDRLAVIWWQRLLCWDDAEEEREGGDKNQSNWQIQVRNTIYPRFCRNIPLKWHPICLPSVNLSVGVVVGDLINTYYFKNERFMRNAFRIT